MLTIIIAAALIAIAVGTVSYVARSPRSAGEAPRFEDASRKHWLIAQTGPLSGQALHIGARAVTIGRGVQNFIQVTDHKVSRRHCQLSVRNGDLHVLDLKSRNGTAVNGSDLMAGRRLRDGDTLHVGSSRFLYKVTGEFEDSMLRVARAADTGIHASTLVVRRADVEVARGV